jgi:6-phosphogluconolactonase
LSNHLVVTRHYSNATQLAQEAAGSWLADVEVARESGRPYFVALSGGRIAQTFFSAVAGSPKVRKDLLDSVHFFWGDERCVPPTDSESNFGIAQRLLLEPLRIPADRIHRIRGEEHPEAAAAQAEAEICGTVPLNETGQPVLDLVILGLGEDGHVASLFPGERESEMFSKRVYRDVVGSKPPPNRVTLGYGAIIAARKAWVLASGPGKENALRESLQLADKTPCGRVLARRTETHVFTDIQTRSQTAGGN